MIKMIKNNQAIGIAYYTAMNAKDLEGSVKLLHPDVRFKSPLASISGKDEVAKSVKGFQAFIIKLTITEAFENNDQAMIVYDLECPPPIGSFRASALMNIKDGLISRIELFFDARPFMQKP